MAFKDHHVFGLRIIFYDLRKERDQKLTFVNYKVHRSSAGVHALHYIIRGV